jgi:excisionase family DNA binding protein
MIHDKRVITIKEFCQAYAIGRTSTYGEINAGRLKTVRLGRRTLIPVDNAEAWLETIRENKKASQ